LGWEKGAKKDRFTGMAMFKDVRINGYDRFFDNSGHTSIEEAMQKAADWAIAEIWFKSAKMRNDVLNWTKRERDFKALMVKAQENWMPCRIEHGDCDKDPKEMGQVLRETWKDILLACKMLTGEKKMDLDLASIETENYGNYGSFNIMSASASFALGIFVSALCFHLKNKKTYDSIRYDEATIQV